MNSLIKNISIAIGLILLQVLVLNNVNIDGLVNPYVFILYLLLFSFDTKGWVLLLVAFLLGLVIDLFNNTIGMQAFATVIIAFLRPIFLSIFQPKSDKSPFPSIRENGFSWMFFYVSTLTIIHHFVYFFIEASSLNNVFHTLLLTFLSSIVSIIISFILLFTFNLKK